MWAGQSADGSAGHGLAVERSERSFALGIDALDVAVPPPPRHCAAVRTLVTEMQNKSWRQAVYCHCVFAQESKLRIRDQHRIVHYNIRLKQRKKSYEKVECIKEAAS